MLATAALLIRQLWICTKHDITPCKHKTLFPPIYKLYFYTSWRLFRCACQCPICAARCEDATGSSSISSARLSTERLIEQRCPALWTMSPFQISGRPIEDNYNLGDTEEHYSSEPSWPLIPSVFLLQIQNLAVLFFFFFPSCFNTWIITWQAQVTYKTTTTTKNINKLICDCKLIS